MLESITLNNYKCFKDETPIKIKPLTILCGVNSSGKSSILKSLLMMKQTTEKESSYNKLSFIGKYVDNGYWDDIINFESLQDKNASFTITNTFVLKPFDPSYKRQDMGSYKELKRLFSCASEFKVSHSITVKKPIIDTGLMQYIDNNEVVETSITINLIDNNENELTDKKCTVSISKINGTERSYYLRYNNLPVGRNVRNNPSYPEGYKCQCYFSNIKLTNIYAKWMSANVIEAKSVILSLFNIASMQYTGIEFIAPLRQNPMRNYIIKGDVDSVGIYGEEAPVLYTKLSGDDKYLIDIPFPEYCDDTNEYIIDFENKSNTMADFKTTVQKWMDYFSLGKISISGSGGLLSLKINNHNIADVGFGVSQIFPIIVQGLCMTKDELLLLEQPEIHLHPKMQMNMADYLLAVASTERNVIVETHSEHIINRIVRRILEDDTRTLHEIIQIYFIEQGSSENIGSVVNPVIINDEYGIEKYPKNFFDQSAYEQLKMMQSGLIKRQKIKDNII